MADLSPTAAEENQARLHPQAQVGWIYFVLQPGRPMAVVPRAPARGPAPSPRPLRDLPQWWQLPPLIELDAVAPEQRWEPQNPVQTSPAGPSARILWALVHTWQAQWSRHAGIPQALVYLIILYAEFCLFHTVPVAFLWDLQRLLFYWLPRDAIAPEWLWRLLFNPL